MARPKEERIKLVSLDKINEPEHEQRTQISEEKLDSLCASIKKIGLIHTISLKPVSGGRYEVVEGHRRYLAHTRLELPVIPARIVEGNELDHEIRKMHENAEREDISALDEARFISRLKNRMKMSQTKIAEAMGKSEAYVSQRLAILQTPEVIKQALDDGVISFSVARELAGIDDLEELARLVVMAANNGITPNIARSWRMQWEAAQQLPKTEEEESEGDKSYPTKIDPAKFECGLCDKPTFVNEMKIIKCCPECYHEVNKK